MTMSRYDVGEVKAYNGFQFPFEKKKKIAKTIGAWVNKYFGGSTNGLGKIIKNQKANVDSSDIVLAERFRNLTPFVLNKL